MAHISRLAAAGALQAALEDSPKVLFQSAVPLGIANSGTIATNGTYTAGTAYNFTYSGGIWLYFPSSAFASGSAGFYWCVASSTTSFQVYTNSSATTLVTGSNAGFTGDTSARTAVTLTVQGGTMGPRGNITVETSSSINNTAGTKNVVLLFGGSSLITQAGTTNTAINGRFRISNRDSQASQRVSSYVSSTAAGNVSTVDTSADQSITINIQIATATDVLVLENYTVTISSGF
jgi:hypothetical protein